MNKALEDYPGEVFSVACNVTELITVVIEMQVNAPELDPQPILLAAERLAREVDSKLDIINIMNAGVA